MDADSAIPTSFPSGEGYEGQGQNVDGQPSLNGQPDPGQDEGSTAAQEANEQPMSKNALKRLKRQEKWDSEKDYRKVKRKAKLKEKKERKRQQFQSNSSSQEPSVSATLSQSDVSTTAEGKRPYHLRQKQLPVTFIIDCSFDALMAEKELKSLASQVTRSYSDNNRAPFQTHLVISSFGGQLRERFETVLASHHKGWRGVRFRDGDYMKAAVEARGYMREEGGGKIAGALKPGQAPTTASSEEQRLEDVIYLTSDSPETLSELSPYTTYIIGGLVDRNRHKGICYKSAMDRGIKTAKLPIGEFMRMNSRFVLATNHVVEIMLRWLELGDWGEAFSRVVPKRKGGVLKTTIQDDPGGEDSPVEDEGEVGQGEEEPSEEDQGEEREDHGQGLVDDAENHLSSGDPESASRGIGVS